MQNVVITGADGFIGRNLVRYMSEKEISVYAVVMRNSQNLCEIQKYKNVKIIQGDLLDWQALRLDLPDNIDAFIHLAWVGVTPEQRDSIYDQIHNIDISINAVRLAASINAKKFIFPGSTLEYAYCGTLINEKACPTPQNAYATLKVSMHYICQELCQELKLPYIHVVITSIYGADRMDNNVISYTIKSLLKGVSPSLTKMTQLWDYVHIDDVVYALYLISKFGKERAFYTLGHGDNWSLSNYIYIIHDIINPEIPLGIGNIPYRNGIQPNSCIDLTSLQKDTGFKPQVTFECGIKGVIEKIKKQFLNNV